MMRQQRERQEPEVLANDFHAEIEKLLQTNPDGSRSVTMDAIVRFAETHPHSAIHYMLEWDDAQAGTILRRLQIHELLDGTTMSVFGRDE